MKPVIMYKKNECLHCGRCINACSRKAISFENKTFIDRSICTGCGECANACPAGALVVKGKTMTVQQLIRELKKDATTYRRSGGGITLSGGEPLVQYEFAAELLRACKAQGWDTAIETTGAGITEAVEKVIPYVDTVLLDIKHLDTEKHKKFTGIGNEQILKNAARISQISSTKSDSCSGYSGLQPLGRRSESDYRVCKNALRYEDYSSAPLCHTFGENKYDLLGRDYAGRH